MVRKSGGVEEWGIFVVCITKSGNWSILSAE